MSSYKASRVYGEVEICEFLRAVDRHLFAPSRMIIIGGAASAFYQSTSTTNDVDTYEAIAVDLQEAIKKATTETGLSIPINHSSVADCPYHFEERLERKLLELVYLEVLVLEKHDLALSKTIRGASHDEQQIHEIHNAVGLSFDTLVQRFRDEMDHIVGDPTRIRQQFLQLLELLFGEMKSVAAKKLLVGSWADR